MDAGGNCLESLRTVIDGIHRRHDGEEHLSGADVAGRFFAANVLFACLQRQAQGQATLCISRNSHQASGHAALVFVSRRQESGVRATISEGHPESLRRADDDVSPVFARRFDQGKRQQIGRHDRQRTFGVHEVDDRAEIVDNSIGGRILNQRSKDSLRRKVPDRFDDQTNSEGNGACPKDGNRLGMAIIGDKEGRHRP